MKKNYSVLSKQDPVPVYTFGVGLFFSFSILILEAKFPIAIKIFVLKEKIIILLKAFLNIVLL